MNTAPSNVSPLSPLISPMPSRRFRWARSLGFGLLWLFAGGMTLWAIGALYYDFPIKSYRGVAALVYACAALAVIVWRRKGFAPLALCVCGFFIVLGWWLTLRPSNDRHWQPDVAQTGWAEINGSSVTLHNVRNCDYRTETDYTPRWETRTVDLTHLRGIDLAIDYWGSAWMAHPIVSFQFDDALPICFSIETRKEVGEEYSAIGGLYRQYELIYICSDERDVIRLRTNYRRGEVIYLYHLTATPEKARERFLEYVTVMNALRDHPRWYNAATTNCTTSIRAQHAASERAPWDWRMLLNGYMDEMLYEHGAFAGDLPFPELKKRALINDAAQKANDAPDFSRQIRLGRPGFPAQSDHEIQFQPRHRGRTVYAAAGNTPSQFHLGNL
jgi:hypothetical protein